MRKLILGLVLVLLALPVVAKEKPMTVKDAKLIINSALPAEGDNHAPPRTKATVVFELSHAYGQQYSIASALKCLRDDPGEKVTLYVNMIDIDVQNEDSIKMLVAVEASCAARIKTLSAEYEKLSEDD